MSIIDVLAVPAFEDNYIWVLHDGKAAWVVDPGESAPVHAALDRFGLSLEGILVTHHHGDHINGIPDLVSRLKGQVYSPASHKMTVPYTLVGEGHILDILGHPVKIMELPGHTNNHIGYFLPGDALTAPMIFSGDVLFSAGCGRVEGTFEQMYDSLMRLSALPQETRLYGTHEYTLANLKFAAMVEPFNLERIQWEEQCNSLRQSGLPTLPTTLEAEHRYNPYLRCSHPSVIQAARQEGAQNTTPLEVFTALRLWKNRFK